MADALALLALLIGLELVLGVDNVLVIAIFVGRLPAAKRQKARIIVQGSEFKVQGSEFKNSW
jgi:predicted tellurium resistance membrane protein TerC